MLKRLCFLISAVLLVTVPVAFADAVNSTINTPDIGFSFSATQNRTNDVKFAETNLEEWNKIVSIESPNIQPIFFPILVLIIFGISFSAGMKAKGEAVAGMFFMLSFIMSLILVLLFSGNLEFGILQEETKSTIDTNTGLFEISKTYHSTKLIPNEKTFRPIFTSVFQMLFFFSIIMFVVKSFLQPSLEKKKLEKQGK